jgi:hypothetical protein
MFGVCCRNDVKISRTKSMNKDYKDLDGRHPYNPLSSFYTVTCDCRFTVPTINSTNKVKVNEKNPTIFGYPSPISHITYNPL